MIPFVDLKAQYHSLKPEIDGAIGGVLESSQFILGPAVGAFEKAFAAYCGTTEAIGVNTGTSALHLALLALGIGAGDEVITTPHTFVASVAAIHYTGARPVYVDIDPRSFTMDPALVEAAITPRTRALLPVHLYGQAANMGPLLDLARKHTLRVIEDACQAHGAEYKGKRVGGLGDVGCFSFYPGKNLGAYGEGGAVTTSDPEIARKVRLLRDWGAPEKYRHELRGYNYRLEGMQGAVLGVKLPHLDRWNAARVAHAARYGELLRGTAVKTPETMPWATRHVFHVYAVRSRGRERLQSFLHDRGIQTGIHYPIPCHLQGAYADPAYPAGTFPHAEEAAAEVLSLPMFPELTDEQMGTVAQAIIDCS